MVLNPYNLSVLLICDRLLLFSKNCVTLKIESYYGKILRLLDCFPRL